MALFGNTIREFVHNIKTIAGREVSELPMSPDEFSAHLDELIERFGSRSQEVYEFINLHRDDHESIEEVALFNIFIQEIANPPEEVKEFIKGYYDRMVSFVEGS